MQLAPGGFGEAANPRICSPDPAGRAQTQAGLADSHPPAPSHTHLNPSHCAIQKDGSHILVSETPPIVLISIFPKSWVASSSLSSSSY